MGKEFEIVDDERLHIAIILPKKIIIFKNSPKELTSIDHPNVGYIAITGRGSRRQIENEDGARFGFSLDRFKKKPGTKVVVVQKI